MQVTLEYAATHIDDMASAADRGEEVKILRPGKPILHLVPEAPTSTKFKGSTRILGAGRGEMIVPTEKEWRAMKREAEREMLDAPLISADEM